ncbi:MAG: hypothetical protein AB7O68_17380 [Pirellulales bacterium]
MLTIAGVQLDFDCGNLVAPTEILHLARRVRGQAAQAGEIITRPVGFSIIHVNSSLNGDARFARLGGAAATFRQPTQATGDCEKHSNATVLLRWWLELQSDGWRRNFPRSGRRHLPELDFSRELFLTGD